MHRKAYVLLLSENRKRWARLLFSCVFYFIVVYTFWSSCNISVKILEHRIDYNATNYQGSYCVPEKNSGTNLHQEVGGGHDRETPNLIHRVKRSRFRVRMPSSGGSKLNAPTGSIGKKTSGISANSATSSFTPKQGPRASSNSATGGAMKTKQMETHKNKNNEIQYLPTHIEKGRNFNTAQGPSTKNHRKNSPSSNKSKKRSDPDLDNKLQPVGDATSGKKKKGKGIGNIPSGEVGKPKQSPIQGKMLNGQVPKVGVKELAKSVSFGLQIITYIIYGLVTIIVTVLLYFIRMVIAQQRRT